MKTLKAIPILEGEIKRLQRKLNEKEEQTFEIDKIKEEKDNLEMDIVDLEKTKKELEEFINEIKKKKFDIVILAHKSLFPNYCFNHIIYQYLGRRYWKIYTGIVIWKKMPFFCAKS